MKTLNFSITINASTSQVRNTMINHPTYEIRTEVFSPGSTYEGDRSQGSDIKFGDGNGEGMLAHIAENRLYEYISIAHKGEIMKNKDGILETKLYDGAGFENYSFTSLDSGTTQLDIELTNIPDDYSDMFSEMWPKSLVILKELCEK